MKIVLLLALALFCWFKGRAFFGKLWLAFVAPPLSKVDDLARRAIVSTPTQAGGERPLSLQQVSEIRSARREGGS